MARSRQHLDVRAGAEHLVQATSDDDSTNLRMLEPEPLDGVVQLDVDGEVVGVQLELIVVAQPSIRSD